MQGGGAPSAANQAVHIAFVQEHRADQRQAAAHFNFRHLHCHTFALSHAVVGLPKITVALVAFDIDHRIVLALAQAQSKFLNALGNDGGATNERGHGNALIDNNLHRAQHALIFAFGKGNALFQAVFSRRKNRLHGGARSIDKALQLFAVSLQILYRAQSHATVSRCLGHRRRDLDHQTRIKGLRDQVLRTECQLLARIGSGHHFALLGLRQFGDGINGCDFHLHRDGRCTGVECAPKYVGETQNIVDLVGVVTASGGHDGVITYGLDLFGQDFRRGIGQRKNQRALRHALHHVGLEYTASGQT